MAIDYRHYRVLDEFIISSPKEEKLGIYRAVQMIKSNDGPVEIRVCYYSRRRRNDGSEWWGLSPRPMAFKPEEAKLIANGIIELSDKYLLIREAIENHD
ncbi:MAG: hypothetical protein GQ558_04370 [Thermoplasmata archaeon]|nr:hypothetical protein [Thermoplasmata archaeon]